MKKGLKITLIILGIFVSLLLIFFAIDCTWFMKYEDLKDESKVLKNSNMVAKMRAVVVRVYDKSLYVMGIDHMDGIVSIGFADEGNIRFTQGQEILIYYDGMVMETYPPQLGKVGKIEIVKEKSNIEIPESVLRYCYSSRDNVSVSIDKLTSRGISFTVTDTNELQYIYSNDYIINKQVKNENYTGIGYKIGEDTENSISGYTRSRS